MKKQERLTLNKSLLRFYFILLLLSSPLLIFVGSSIMESNNFPSNNPSTQQSSGNNNYNATGSYDYRVLANYTTQGYNLTTVDIDLPPNNWNVTEINLEFDNISLGQEQVTIEDNPDSFQYIRDQDVEVLAMQLKIDELTVIYSIEIFGYKSETHPNPATLLFGITGWDSGNHEPDTGTIYGSFVELNLSNIPGWHLQTFPEPITLNPGDYGILMTGYELVKPGDQYFWYINNSATGSNLYMSYWDKKFIGWDWENRYEDVFLHRINRWVNKSYNPTELNMTVEVEDTFYQVSDGATPGSGNLLVKNLTLIPLEDNLVLPVLINKSLKLNFDLNSTLSLSEVTTTPSRVQIGDNSSNYWYLYPVIERCGCDLRVEIPIAPNWSNLQVYKNDINITTDPNIIILNNTLIILNDTIEESAEWIIYATSIPKIFALNSSSSIYNPAEDISITVQSEFLQGTYYLQIRDPNNNTLYEQPLDVDDEIETFHYLIRNDAIEGFWTATVYWYNATDAGFSIFTFYVEVPVIIPPLDPLVIIIAVLSGALITGISYGSYKIIQLNKRKEATRNKLLENKVKDLLNLQYLMVVDKNSSLDLFTQSFSEKKLDLSLVSGFLEAIRSFGIELTESSEQSQIIKLEYHESKIIMSEYKGFRLILIMKDVPSHEFLDSIKDLLVSIDEKFSRFLSAFKGDIRPFKYIERLIVQILGTSFIYPLKIMERPKVKLNSFEKDFIKRAKMYLKTANKDYIFISQLINLKKFNPMVVRQVNSLIKKRVFEPIIGHSNE